MKTRLRFSQAQIQAVASRYNYALNDEELVSLRPKVLARGCLTKDELVKLAYWKAPRSAGKVTRNSEAYVREITGFALSAKEERARIELLTILDGVSWPTASVVLHFFHRALYPIMDFRALWSVSLELPAQYGFDLWWKYVQFCRGIAASNGIDMRTLDRALWQYSKENQPKA